MKRLVLGTAGHIDHGKTSLVRALTGTDTDRLKEEKERGITIELGFAELVLRGVRFGVVDVPGHEGFVRTMVAGAAGTDVVLLAVAADEGVMPQTREHLDIIRALGVEQLIVALTKCDAADREWMEVVDSELDDLLASTPYRSAPRVRTSTATGAGLDELRSELARAASIGRAGQDGDLLRLPADRVFSVAGAGTVVTGTLWSGTLRRGDRVRVLPAGSEARVRGLQVHGRAADFAQAGERVAVALVGEGADRDSTARGCTIVSDQSWRPAWMLTIRAEVFRGTSWQLKRNQRVRVHLATAQSLARVALLASANEEGDRLHDGEPLAGEGLLPVPDRMTEGDVCWVQLRLEKPMVARARDRLIIRNYSPATSIAGGVVAEPAARKRGRLTCAERTALAATVDGSPTEATEGLLALAGRSGLSEAEISWLAGLPPCRMAEAAPSGTLRSRQLLFAESVWRADAAAVTSLIDDEHRRNPLLPAVSAARVRSVLPNWVPAELSAALMDRLVEEGAVRKIAGGYGRPGHRPTPSSEQEKALRRLSACFHATGATPVEVAKLPSELGGREDVWSLLRHLESEGALTLLGDGLFAESEALEAMTKEVRSRLGGRSGLGPADFREVLKVSRKKMLPLLNHFDSVGVTLRRNDGRVVFGERS